MIQKVEAFLSANGKLYPTLAAAVSANLQFGLLAIVAKCNLRAITTDTGNTFEDMAADQVLAADLSIFSKDLRQLFQQYEADCQQLENEKENK